MRKSLVDMEGMMGKMRLAVLFAVSVLLAAAAGLPVAILAKWGWRDFWQDTGPLAEISKFDTAFGVGAGLIVIFIILLYASLAYRNLIAAIAARDRRR